MRGRWGRVLLGVALTGAALAGREARDHAGTDAGSSRGPALDAAGSSGGGSGGNGNVSGGGGGQVSGSGGGGGQVSVGGGSNGATVSGGGTTAPAPSDGSSGGSGGGHGTIRFSSGDGTTNTTSNVPPDEQAPGHSTHCPSNTPPDVDCYSFSDDGNTAAVRVPDSSGGTVLVPVAPNRGGDGSSNSGSSGASTSAGSNATFRVDVHRNDYRIYQVQGPKRHQRVWLTLAVLLLILVAAVGGAMFERRRPKGPTA